ncbi:Ig-like domain-containing protein, partial [Brevibacillus laterosporus]|uniref:Ig-like domain-containing protein n=1 Tax=Brevibacillus laterosporus TaxID=1465 RepID=UPI0020C7C9C5
MGGPGTARLQASNNNIRRPSIRVKNKNGQEIGSSSGYDVRYTQTVSEVSNTAIMVYPLDSYPDAHSVYYYGEDSAGGTLPSTDNISFTGSRYDPNLLAYGGSFKITETVISQYLNNRPTLALTSPPNNQTLTENATLNIQGTASDTDKDNVVTIKYRINNGTTRALQSGVSNGSTPISFAKTLTFRAKRLYDGTTDLTGSNLAENTDHTLTIWAEDDEGGKSTEVTRKFRVVHNRPPVISGQNVDLGVLSTIPSKTYTVTEPEGDAFTIT